MAEKKKEENKQCCGMFRKFCCKGEKLAVVGWVLLLVGGLAHMLPAQMAPILNYAAWGISVQMVVGILSVIVALNFLLGDE